MNEVLLVYDALHSYEHFPYYMLYRGGEGLVWEHALYQVELRFCNERCLLRRGEWSREVSVECMVQFMLNADPCDMSWETFVSRLDSAAARWRW